MSERDGFEVWEEDNRWWLLLNGWKRLGPFFSEFEARSVGLLYS